MKIKLYFLIKRLVRKLPSSKIKSKLNTFLFLYSTKKHTYCVSCSKILLKKHGGFCSIKCLNRKQDRAELHTNTQRKVLGDKLYEEIYSSKKFMNLNYINKKIISSYPPLPLLSWYKSKK